MFTISIVATSEAVIRYLGLAFGLGIRAITKKLVEQAFGRPCLRNVNSSSDCKDLEFRNVEGSVSDARLLLLIPRPGPTGIPKEVSMLGFGFCGPLILTGLKNTARLVVKQRPTDATREADTP